MPKTIELIRSRTGRGLEGVRPLGNLFWKGRAVAKLANSIPEELLLSRNRHSRSIDLVGDNCDGEQLRRSGVPGNSIAPFQPILRVTFARPVQTHTARLAWLTRRPMESARCFRGE
jgi:hypothetical protein